MPKKNLTIQRVTEGEWSVYYNPARNYGCYESMENGLRSGMWFVRRRLDNSNGTYFVPLAVIKILRSMKLVVPRNFEKRKKK